MEKPPTQETKVETAKYLGSHGTMKVSGGLHQIRHYADDTLPGGQYWMLPDLYPGHKFTSLWTLFKTVKADHPKAYRLP